MTNSETAYKTEYLWKIDHFKLYDAQRKDLDSPIFHATNDCKYKWNLQLQFKHENYIAFFLSLGHIGIRPSVFAQFKFAILDNEGLEIYMSSNNSSNNRWNRIFEFCQGSKQSCGITGYIPNELVKDKLLYDDQLTVYCAVIYSERCNFTADFNQPILKYLQTICNYHTLSKNLASLLTNPKYSDAILSVKDKKFHVHKNILTACSSVFNAMFTHNMKESQNNQIEISDVEENVVEQMLRYIYTGRCDDLREQTEELFVAADKYDLNVLKLECEKALGKNLSIQNAIRILIMADMHNANELKLNVIHFIVENSKKLVRTKNWDDMVVSYPQLFNDIFKASLSYPFQK